jgi:hypothetical protein
MGRQQSGRGVGQVLRSTPYVSTSDILLS